MHRKFFLHILIHVLSIFFQIEIGYGEEIIFIRTEQLVEEVARSNLAKITCCPKHKDRLRLTDLTNIRTLKCAFRYKKQLCVCESSETFVSELLRQQTINFIEPIPVFPHIDPTREVTSDTAQGLPNTTVGTEVPEVEMENFHNESDYQLDLSIDDLQERENPTQTVGSGSGHPYKCKTCIRTFTSKGGCTRHENICQTRKCRRCKKRFPRTDLRAHGKTCEVHGARIPEDRGELGNRDQVPPMTVAGNPGDHPSPEGAPNSRLPQISESETNDVWNGFLDTDSLEHEGIHLATGAADPGIQLTDLRFPARKNLREIDFNDDQHSDPDWNASSAELVQSRLQGVKQMLQNKLKNANFHITG